MNKTGKEYEIFVANLQQAILKSEEYGIQKNIVIEKNKIIKDKNGIDREFDLYWEYELGGFTYKTVIECKDYKSPITIEKIDSLIGKISDIPEIKPVFATKSKYQSGAKKKAKQHGIELLIVRGENESDWQDEYANQLLNENAKTFTEQIILPTTISYLYFTFDKKWVLDNKIDVDVKEPFCMKGSEFEVFINDVFNNETYALHALPERLTALEKNQPGEYKRTIEFYEAYLLDKELKLKIRSYDVTFSIPQPVEFKFTVGFSTGFLGVVEYINKGIKLRISKNGNIKQDILVGT